MERRTGSVDPYDNPAGINLLVAVDEFGRTVPVSGANKKDRAVGIMYWLWHGSYANRAVDTTKIIEEKGLDYALYNLKDYNPQEFRSIGASRYTAITARTTSI